MSTWQAGLRNVQRGLAITRQQPDLYLKLIVLYSIPPLAAAWVVLFKPSTSQPLAYLLPVITMVVAPVVLMQAVEAGHDGERIGVLEATRRGVPSVPRYVWTNVHTTVLFWVPVGALVLLRDLSPLPGRAERGLGTRHLRRRAAPARADGPGTVPGDPW